MRNSNEYEEKGLTHGHETDKDLNKIKAYEERTDRGSGKNSYAVDYNDERFTKVETEKQEALTELEQTYGGIVDKSDKYFADQIDAAKQWGEQQSQLQQEKTDFVIEQIEQQKQEAEEDYIDEQSGAYADWKEQDSEFGVEAEQRAAQGMSNTGYSESVKARNWNTYQTRLTAARVAVQRIIQNFNNQMNEARLQNNVVLAEIAFNTLQKELELSLQGFQFKNQLLLEQFNKQMEVDQMFHTRWQDVLNQINTENALAEQIRQFNESMALQREQFEWQKAQAAAAATGGGGYYSGGDNSNGGGGSNYYSGWDNSVLQGMANDGVAKYEAKNINLSDSAKKELNNPSVTTGRTSSEKWVM